MARLSSIKSRLEVMKPRLIASPANDRDRSRMRDDQQKWRKWYKTARWRKLRLKILKRDSYTCQRTGVLLSGKYPAPNSAVVDHISAHRGNEVLFWDENNLQAVSKEYHDREKQRLEKIGWA